MKEFHNIQSFLDYIPNCLICHRPLQVIFESWVKEHKLGKRHDCGGQNVKAMIHRIDNLVHFKHKSHSVSIDVETNQFVDDAEFGVRLSNFAARIRKSCPTCHFKVRAQAPNIANREWKVFPHLTLDSEELRFTLRGGKQFQVKKDYDRLSDPIMGNLFINGKLLPPVPFELDKFKNFDQLKNRINTILIFH